MAAPRIIVVGGGLAGLAAVIKIAEAGGNVDLFSIVPVKRSHSVCAQGGINAAKNLKGEGDTTDKHFDDTIYGGDFLANQTPVKAMCEAAPGIIDLLDRMGVPFNRTPEGLLDFRRFGGTLYNRTAFAGATTGQQLLYALDEQVRRYESDGKVKKYEGWEFLSAVLDSKGVARGITALEPAHHGAPLLPRRRHHPRHRRHRRHLRQKHQLRRLHRLRAIRHLPAGRLLRQRRIHPGPPHLHPRRRQAAPHVRVGARRRRPRLGSAHRPATSAPSSRFPSPSASTSSKSGIPNTATSSPATSPPAPFTRSSTSTASASTASPWSISTSPTSTAPRSNRKLEGILEIYEKFVGDDPREVPMKIFPGMHYTMGGLWVDFNQMTNIPGIFAAGECEYQYHGANRLGANSLVSCIFGGFQRRPQRHRTTPRACPQPKATAAQQPSSRARPKSTSKLINNEGTENPFKLWRELGATMTEHATVIRYNKGLKQADEKIVELLDRYKNVNLSDKSQWANTSFAFARQLKNMLELSRTVVQGAHAARRVARRALQARLPRPQRREVSEDHQGQLHRRTRRPALRVRRSRHAVHQAAPAPLRRHQIG